jgi:hypothetical protein
MARLVIRILPNAHPTDPSLTPLRTQEGDVVELVDDGHVFSFAELNCGQYRIMDVPGVPQDELVHLKAHVEDAQGRMTKRRAQQLDLTVLRTPAWRDRTTATKAEIATLTRTKP